MKERTVAVIQARINSTRLPGKILMDFAGKPILWHIVERVKRAKKVDYVMVACPKDDWKVLNEKFPYRAHWGLTAPRRDDNDLIGRFVDAGESSRASTIVRICADNPFVDPTLIDDIVIRHQHGLEGTLYTNMENPNGAGDWPDGVGAEVYSMGLLHWMDEHITDKTYREHPHRYFYDNHHVFSPECPKSLARPDIRLDVNTRDDFERMRELFEAVYYFKKDFTTHDVIGWYDTIGMVERKASP